MGCIVEQNNKILKQPAWIFPSVVTNAQYKLLAGNTVASEETTLPSTT
jgi:hypothetical protein